MSDFARIGVVISLFVVLLSIGGAVGLVFYFSTVPQPDRSDLSQLSPNLARSDKTDSVFDVRQRLSLDRPSDKTARIEPSSMPDPEASHVPAVEPNFPVAEPIFEPSPRSEDVEPAQTDSITAPTEPNLTGPAEPDLTSSVPPKIGQPTPAPSVEAGLGTVTPSKAVRRRSEPCRNEACRQALAECSKLCDAAMTLSVAACPRVSSGASDKDEKACLAKWDRRRRDCHSGCALRQTRALKAR